MNFNDLHVVVSGGTGALGLAVVERLLTAGFCTPAFPLPSPLR